MQIYPSVALVLLAVAFQANAQATNWRTASLTAHNKYRSKHGSPALALADDVNTSAQKCADYLASKKQMAHICREKFGHNYGENLASGSGLGATAEKAGVTSTDMWYNEEPKYDYSKNAFQPAAGHFSQVVWKSSARLGMGYAVNGSFKIVVAHYDPAGNMGGQYTANVQRPQN